MPAPLKPNFSELGATGLVQYSGYIKEEILRELSGPRWVRNVREMTSNDPIICAAFFAIDKLTRQVTWEIQPGSEDNADLEIADFVRGCLFDDMSQPWRETISEIHSYLPWGYSPHELVYKRRNGESSDPSKNSKFNDGKIGWRKWPIRAQESIQRWDFDDNGGIQGLFQRAAPRYLTVQIPIEKMLLFRTLTHKNNPEGHALCRPIFRPWFFKQRIENFEAIGIERDLNGVPLMRIPAEYLDPEATGAIKAIGDECRRIVTGVHANEMAGVLIPSEVVDGSTLRQFEFELISTNGVRSVDARKVIQGKNLEILLTLLLDFLLMGHEKVGSFALASSKTDTFGYALGAFLDSDCEIVNRHAIPRLLRLNGMSTEKPPKLTHGDVESLDLMEIANFIATMSGAGFDVTPQQLSYLLKQGGLPVPDDPNEMKKQKPDESQPPPGNTTGKPPDAGNPGAKQVNIGYKLKNIESAPLDAVVQITVNRPDEGGGENDNPVIRTGEGE